MEASLRPSSLKKIVVLFCLLFSIGNLFSQHYYNYLRVLDPRNSWWGPQGNIDSAIFVIEPKGIYAQVDMFLQFSAIGSYFSEYDTLEVQMNFNLPSGAIVNDSWLLIYDKWEKALILDRWTATSIYEGIVQRRKDPSILTKNSAENYSLNVFPMAATESRTARISFLLPFNFTSKSATINLPVNLLSLSLYTPKVKVSIKENMGFINPVLANNVNVTFTNDSFEYKNTETEISNINVVSFDSPMKDGIFLSKYNEGNDGVYQLAFIPSHFIENNADRKLIILVDNENEGYYKNDEISNALKVLAKNSLSDKDSFNIIFSGLKTKMLSDNWLPVNNALTDSLLSAINDNFYSGYSDLVSLFSEGLNLAENNTNTSILLISNSSDFDGVKTANAFVEDLKKTYMKMPPIFIFDYKQGFSSGYYGGNKYYYGNSYLYEILSRSTGGTQIKLNYGEFFYEKLLSLAQNIGTYIPAFDMVTTLENGFCYGRMNVTNTSQIYANKPVLSVGKYKGSFPMELQISGLIEDTIFSTQLTIDESLSYDADSVSRTIWAGNYVKEMESATNLNNEEISKIINFSISNRVLSLYTAFLTLEPGMVIEPCEDCTDEDGNPITTPVVNVKKDEAKVEVFGNPFKDKVRIKVSLEKPVKNALTVQIYNAMGQLIKAMKVNPSMQYFEFEWDGKDQNGKVVTAGTYIVKLSSESLNMSVKVMKK